MTNASKARIREAIEIIESVLQSHADSADAIRDVSKLDDEQIDELLLANGFDNTYLENFVYSIGRETASAVMGPEGTNDVTERTQLQTSAHERDAQRHLPNRRVTLYTDSRAGAASKKPVAAERKRPAAQIFRRPIAGERVIARVPKRVLVQAVAAAGLEPFQTARTSQGVIEFFEIGRSIAIRISPQAKPTVLRLSSIDHFVSESTSEHAKKYDLLKVDGLDRIQVNHFVELYERQPGKFKIRWR
jgi:hypothetical protein